MSSSEKRFPAIPKPPHLRRILRIKRSSYKGAGQTAEWTARQVTEAFPWDEPPDALIRDNDAIYGGAYKKKLESMGIRDGPTALRSPWQNGHAERLIGSIRRECLDHIIIRDENHLRRVLRAYAKYYNSARTHLSLEKNSPAPRNRQDFGCIIPRPHLGGLHHEYARIG